ncbi:microtubule-associated protein 10 [Electrophorus electricus]|uniref:microtubule-associated protein 10 n=1 Tax=Electrophorus electricus TaxID=8005 RepID=UPI0015D0AE44|nr:microtubule-associated protein 10 [Electrophorus electricus]
MADTNQTLFSFELFVEYVSVDNTRKINMEPAVAMRLLDFPTLLIYHSENDDPSSKPVSEKVHLLSETYLYSEENSFVYSFKKGKSCLFEINLNSLHAHLSNTPLYTMLLDVSGTIPKLIGSSVISLAKLTNRVKLDVEKRGIWTPASYGEKVISPILNLKGENIGAISLAYKIVSLGASLIPRISESKLDEICASLKPNSTSTENNGADEIQPCLPENVTCNAPSQPDEQSTEVLLSETKVTHDAAETTQTEYIKKKDISVVTEVECGELLWHTFCPPPLFYCCREKNRHAEMESFRLANLSNKHTEDMVTSAEMECTYQINGPKRGEQNRLVSDVAVQHSHTVPSFLGDAILQLPLLNALIGELSHLSDQTHQQQHPFSVPPNLVWLCTSAEQPSPTPASGNIDKTGYLKTAASPIQTAVQLLSPRQSTSHVPLKGQQERPYHKSKLGYGLTRTFHLRLKQYIIR